MPRSRSSRGAVTLGDVAARAGVSLQTISNAINAPHKLAPATLQRSLEAIEELGYRPNRAARALRNQRSKLIAVKAEPLSQGRAGILSEQFLHALSVAATERGYHLILCNASDDAAELAAYQELLVTTAVDAVILHSTHSDDPRLRWLRDRGIAFATFGRAWGQAQYDSWVDVDGRDGTRQATDHLVEIGHRRVGYVGWGPPSNVGHERHQGWLDSCATHRLPTDQLTADAVDSIEAGMAGARKLLTLDEPPTGIVCSSDTLALGVIRALHFDGLRPGHDVAVTGFDDSVPASLATPALTSVRQPLEDVARALVSHVDGELSGQDHKPPNYVLTPTLVIRESTVPSPSRDRNTQGEVHNEVAPT